MIIISLLEERKRTELEQSQRIHSAGSGSYLHNPGSEPLNFATLGEVISRTAHKYPGRVAVKSIHENLTLTYEDLLNNADAFGCALRCQGLEKGDRVGIWSHNAVSWLVAVIGAARAGLISVLINPMYEKNELAFCIKKTEMKSLLIGDKLFGKKYYDIIRKLVPELDSAKPGFLKSKDFPSLNSVITDGKEKLNGTFLYNSLISENVNKNDISRYGSEVKPEDGSIIHFTSGTTGEPKAALDSHLGLVNNTYFTGKRNTFHEGHHIICVQVPLFHALGSVITILGGLSHGGSFVLAAPSYSVTANINALYGEKCTAITGTPTMYVDILSQIRSKGLDVPSGLRMALAAGAPCSPQLIRDIQKYLKADSVKGLYGLTETTASVFQSIEGDSIDIVAETVGYIQDHVEAKVVDKEGKIVPFGSPGELVVRGYNNMICYWNEPQKTQAAFVEDGWLLTGDKFTISEDGYGRIVGRLKDIIVRGGENVAPKEIEDLLNVHPDIIESQVIGVPDERLGEELCAVLRVREGASITLDEITRHCSGHLARFKIPRVLKLTNEFPKTASGKIQKYRLKEMVEAGLYCRYSYAGRLLAKLPGPKGIPIFGNMFDIWLDPEGLFVFARKLHKDYGGLSKVTGFMYRCVNISNPEDLETVLSLPKFNEKWIPYLFLHPWLGNGLLVSNGDRWHHRRKLLTPAFHFNILKRFSVIFSEQAEELFEIIEKEVGKEKTAIQPLIMKSTLRIMCETSMGTSMREDIRSVANKYFNALMILGECIVHRFTSMWLYSPTIFKWSKVAKIQNLALKDLHGFTRQIIRERREYRENNPVTSIEVDDGSYGGKTRLAMLDMLLEQEKLGKIDEEGIREEVDTFMFEGHDTTSMALCFIMMRIASEPVIQTLIYEEMQRIFGDSRRSPTVENLAEMKYLECCIKEALRLYPSVPYFARHVSEEAVLSGYKIPGDTVYNIHVFDLHRIEDIYPDPEKFIPERFLSENIMQRHPYAYIPFSAGPRNCIGQKFAMMEMKTVMSGLIRRFHLHPVTRHEDLTFICDIVLRVKEPVYVRFTKRNPMEI
ncbi:hypothetical protein K1T71_008687 [Dendrolimus kikuchii]|uniref:Uncharacterized protein n=1 Tax=Dendrolimus kikuchii TaxID=765133 RepID=A0ACC1CW50_9NEOP|nr:hypothetical protein K1T71_008687 [Dendrolimus kikuchii]